VVWWLAENQRPDSRLGLKTLLASVRRLIVVYYHAATEEINGAGA